MWRDLIIYHSLLWAKKFGLYKKIAIFMEINVKGLFIQGVKKEFIIQHPVLFWPVLRAPAKKTDATFSIQFQKLVTKCGLRIISFFFQN